MTKTNPNEELTILYPSIKITIAGIEVEIKEYSLQQQLRYNHKLAPFVASLQQELAKSDEFSVDDVIACVADNYQDVLELIAISISQPVEFVANLSGEDAENLLLTWWAVNSNFFTRKAVTPIMERLAKDNLKTLAGARLSSY